MKQKIDLVPGKKYPGYGVVNDYGEFEFIPEQTGSRKGSTSLIKETDDFTLSTTRKKLIIHIRLEKAQGLKLVQKFLSVTNDLITELRNYEF